MEHLINIPYTIGLDVEGSKKGGGGGGGAKEDPNTLKSNAVARILVAISEGEIGGFVNADIRKDIYFDQTPLMNANGTLNFEGVEVDYRVGLPEQQPIQGIASVENTLQVNTQVKKNRGPTVRTVSSKDIDSVRVIVDIQSLVKIDKKSGDQSKTEIQVKFEVFDETVQVWEDRGTHTIAGKCTAPYQQAFRLKRPAGSDRWLVRMTRVTDDSDTSYMQNDCYWGYTTEIQEERLKYNNTSYVYVKVSIDKFGNSIPKLSFRVKGIKVRVPTNYNQNNIGTPGALVYNGAWNGTWKREATDNPVWLIYELLTNERFGLGIDESYINVFEWLPMAKYADGCNSWGQFEGVDNGRGGKRARFTVRTQLVSQQDALSVINTLASSMRAITYWGAGTIQLSMDMPKEPVFAFGETNVIDGNFTYGSTSMGDLYTQANVTWNNPDNFYEQDIATYEDGAAKARLKQTLTTDVVKYGCTNEAEAEMFARWLVDTAQTQTETVQFSISGAHWALRPGDIFTVADKNWANVDWSGRMFHRTPPRYENALHDGPTGPESEYHRYANEDGTGFDDEWQGGYYTQTVIWDKTDYPLGYFKVRLDKKVLLDYGTDYELTVSSFDEAVYHITGSRFITFKVHSMTARGVETDYIYLEQDDRFPALDFIYYNSPTGNISQLVDVYELFGRPNTFWSMRSNKFTQRQFMCMNLREVRTSEFEVTGITYDPNKFKRVEEQVILPSLPTRKPVTGGPTPSPRGLTFKLQPVIVGGVTQNNLIVNWPFVPGAVGYKVSYKFNGGAATAEVTVDVPEFVITNVANGSYEFTVKSVDVLGVSSAPTAGTYVVASNPNGNTGGSTGGDDTGSEGQPSTPPTTGTSTMSAPRNPRLKTIGGTTFNTPDAVIEWDAPLTIPTGMSVAFYEFTVINASTGIVRRREVVNSGREFTYTYSLNTTDTLSRTFKVQIRAIDNVGNFTQGVEATFNNPAPAVPALVSVSDTGNLLTLVHALPAEADAKGTIVCADITPGFTPSTSNQVYQGTGLTHQIQAAPETTFYFRYAVYDSFTDDPSLLTWSTEYTETTGRDLVYPGSYTGRIVTPINNQEYEIVLSATDPFGIARLNARLVAGTLTMQLLRNNTVVGSVDVDGSLCIEDVQVIYAEGDELSIKTINVDEAVALNFQIDGLKPDV